MNDRETTNRHMSAAGAHSTEQMPFLMTPGGLVRLALLTVLCLLVSGAGIFSQEVRDDIALFPVLVVATIGLVCSLIATALVRHRDRQRRP